MDVYATLKIEEAEAIEAIHEQGDGAVLQVGFELYPIISVDAESMIVEVGSPDAITYH